MPTIGHIGRYALKYQLGDGGLGTVFAAHDPLLSRLIAVKTLNVEITDDERESFNALFLNEARAAGGLSHPHIVTVFDAGISDNRAYIAMELLKGRDLRQLRQEGWRATPAQAALIVRRVADALAFAHSQGRDPSRHQAGQHLHGRPHPAARARLRHRPHRAPARQRRRDDIGAGSPYYMAPEQVRRETGRPARRRVLARRRALRAADRRQAVPRRLAEEITEAVLKHEPPLANKVDPTVPKALAEIAARAMEKDPEQRFRSARSFARELRQWLDDNPASPDGEATARPCPAPPSRRRVAARPGSPPRRWRSSAAGTTAVWWQRRAVVPATTAPPRRRRHRSRPPTCGRRQPTSRRRRRPPSRCAARRRRRRSPRPAHRDPGAAAPADRIPTGANNAAAQEALLLASIVPMPALASARRRTGQRHRAGADVGRDRAARAEAPTSRSTPTSQHRRRRPAAKESAKERRAREASEREARERELRRGRARRRRRHRHRADRDQPLGPGRGRRHAVGRGAAADRADAWPKAGTRSSSATATSPPYSRHGQRRSPGQTSPLRHKFGSRHDELPARPCRALRLALASAACLFLVACAQRRRRRRSACST